MKTIKNILLASFIISCQLLNAQSTGIIKGTVSDSTGSPMPLLTVAVLEESTIVTAATTDFNGDYTIKDLTPGEYTLQFSFVGCTTKKIKGVIVDPSKIAYVSTKMSSSSIMLGTAEKVETLTQSIINPTFSTITPIRIDQIEHMPMNPGDIVAMVAAVTPAAMPTEDGLDIQIRGARVGTTQYIVDGNKLIGSPEVPGLSISNMEVITGGIPAEYGDTIGGVVIITTKDYKWEMRRKAMAKREKEKSQDNVND